MQDHTFIRLFSSSPSLWKTMESWRTLCLNREYGGGGNERSSRYFVYIFRSINQTNDSGKQYGWRGLIPQSCFRNMEIVEHEQKVVVVVKEEFHSCQLSSKEPAAEWGRKYFIYHFHFVLNGRSRSYFIQMIYKYGIVLVFSAGAAFWTGKG